MVNEHLYVLRDAGELQAIAEAYLADDAPPPNSDWELAEQKIGSWEIDPYQSKVDEPLLPYSIIRQYIADPDPDKVLKALETAGLLGNGRRRWSSFFEVARRASSAWY